MVAAITVIVAIALGAGVLGVARLFQPVVFQPVVSPPVNSKWRSRARCAGTGVGDFFATEPASALRELCASCPVRSQCYQTAQSNNLAGYWGGTTYAQRRGPFAYIRYLFITAVSLVRVTAKRAKLVRA